MCWRTARRVDAIATSGSSFDRFLAIRIFRSSVSIATLFTIHDNQLT